ncbi:MAG: endolytic transglycosylase MltG [Spirochaetaceae bacterium]|jgi:UPF0755 protein|nr:endolytic transglycosylase MltG [Spirochaetaceae bacterium]
MKKRNVFSVVAGMLVCGFLLAVSATILIMIFNAPPSRTPVDTEGVRIESDGRAVIDIQDGESSIAAGRRLFEAGIINSVLFWNILSRFEREYIKAGVYQIDLPVSQIALHKILQKGRQKLLRLMVPEGATLRKTAAILEEEGVCTAVDFLRAASSRALLDEYHVPGETMEGYLYPDTYLFQANYPAERAVRKMADTFFSRLDELGLDAYSLTPGELYEKVTLASIIEREYRVAEEAAVIAGVFKNRLESGMRLESCATIEYIITEIQGKPHPRRLFNRDVQIQNPYNTYIRSGLPPGPIAAPGAVALKAAFAPEDNDFLFFRVVDPASGTHYFSKTFDEHIEAGELLVKGNR